VKAAEILLRSLLIKNDQNYLGEKMSYDPNTPSQPRSFLSRLILPALILLFGFFMYMSQTQENPVTGEKQHVAFSPDQEIRLGLESAPQMSREMGGELPASDPRVKEVQKMGALLVNDTKARKSPWKFEFHVLADKDTVNAFALPGGQIFITLGLLNRLQNEAQLAGVLSHEMGHVIERHTAQQMSKSQLGQFFIVAIGAAASDPEGYGANNSAAMIAGMVNQMIQLRYSRGDESEADVWGLKLMAQAGYDPYEMIKVMEILKAATGDKGQGPSFFQTHPNPDLRIEEIKAYLKEHPQSLNLQKGRSLREVFQSAPAASESQERSWTDILQSLPY